MKIKYVGPKPIISHEGIEFDNNDEDAFAYLNIAVQMLKSLTHEHIHNGIYVYNTSSPRLSYEELNEELQNYCQNMHKITTIENEDVISDVELEIKNAHSHIPLSTQDRIALENNINLMREYILQRAINNHVYDCIIKELTSLVIKTKTTLMITPMFQKFSHILHSIKDSLLTQTPSVGSSLEVYQDGANLLIKLQVQSS